MKNQISGAWLLNENWDNGVAGELWLAVVIQTKDRQDKKTDNEINNLKNL